MKGNKEPRHLIYAWQRVRNRTLSTFVEGEGFYMCTKQAPQWALESLQWSQFFCFRTSERISRDSNVCSKRRIEWANHELQRWVETSYLSHLPLRIPVVPRFRCRFKCEFLATVVVHTYDLTSIEFACRRKRNVQECVTCMQHDLLAFWFSQSWHQLVAVILNSGDIAATNGTEVAPGLPQQFFNSAQQVCDWTGLKALCQIIFIKSTNWVARPIVNACM